MQPVKVVVAHSDSNTAAQIAASLHKYFRSVSVARSLDEVRAVIPEGKAGPELAVIDLETVSLPELEKLCRDFRDVPVVCTHRLPDDEMWAEALAAGAVDVCQTNDIASILYAVRRNTAMVQANAA